MKKSKESQGIYHMFTKVIRGVFILFFLLNLVVTYGQKQQGDVLGSWFVVAGSNKISNRLSIPTVGIWRHYKLFENNEFVFFRTGLTYHVDKNFSMTGGAAYLKSEAFLKNDFSTTTEQFWIYEEMVMLSKLKKISISNRLRLETRWIYKTEETTINNRFRYRLQGKFPLNDNYYLKVYNEYFLNTKAPYFNQNRFFCGFGYRFLKSLQVEIGYLKNHFKVAHYDRIRLAVYFKTNFVKPKTSKID